MGMRRLVGVKLRQAHGRIPTPGVIREGVEMSWRAPFHVAEKATMYAYNVAFLIHGHVCVRACVHTSMRVCTHIDIYR